MGQKEGDGLGALGSAMTGDGAARDLDIAARLAIVQGRLDDGQTGNPNLSDTPYNKVAHGFWFDDRIRA